MVEQLAADRERAATALVAFDGVEREIALTTNEITALESRHESFVRSVVIEHVIERTVRGCTR